MWPRWAWHKEQNIGLEASSIVKELKAKKIEKMSDTLIQMRMERSTLVVKADDPEARREEEETKRCCRRYLAIGLASR